VPFDKLRAHGSHFAVVDERPDLYRNAG
jgi:hypothetical protein